MQPIEMVAGRRVISCLFFSQQAVHRHGLLPFPALASINPAGLCIILHRSLTGAPSATIIQQLQPVYESDRRATAVTPDFLMEMGDSLTAVFHSRSEEFDPPPPSSFH